jgi:hypothetical protein
VLLPLLLLLPPLLLPGGPPGPSEEALARKLLELVKATAATDAAGEQRLRENNKLYVQPS